MENGSKQFLTSDLGLCTALVTLGFPLDSLDRSDPSRVQFGFQRNNQLDDVVQGYWQRTLLIEPLAYFSNIKVTKNRIYSR